MNTQMQMTENFAMVFPGQGSQSLGMLNDFAKNKTLRDTFEEASQALGYDLWEVCQTGPIEKLNRTDYTQPALLTAGIALFRMWRAENNPLPVVFAGHSLGEYTALVAAEALSLRAAVCLVAERGRLMQEAMPEGQGSMAAILGLEPALLAEICADVCREEQWGLVSPANYNAPGQIVIAGKVEAVSKAMELAKEKGAKRAIALPVSVASHCEYMKGAAEKFKVFIDQVDLKIPKIPVLHNVDVESYQDLATIRSRLVAQLSQPVRWVETIERMENMGIQTWYECGPAAVLTGLNKRIVKSDTARCESLSAAGFWSQQALSSAA